MSFKEALISCAFINASNYKGRAGSSEFWQFALFLFLVFACILLIHTIFQLPYLILIALGAIGLWLLQVASIRRLHDVNKKGWLLFPSWLSFMILLDVYLYNDHHYRWLLLAVSILVWLAFMLNLVLTLSKPSLPQDNCYGPPATIKIIR